MLKSPDVLILFCIFRDYQSANKTEMQSSAFKGEPGFSIDVSDHYFIWIIFVRDAKFYHLQKKSAQ